MKKLSLIILFLPIVFSTTSCEEQQPLCCGITEKHGEGLVDTWLLYETGHSPGAGYVTEPVSPEPPQTITFYIGNKMSSNIPGLMDFQYYEMGPDVLVLHQFDPYTPNPRVNASYTIKLEDDDLRLNFRYCIEGCHMAFKRVELSQE